MLEGLELIVSDHCDDETTRLSVFHWDQDAETYQPKGHFRGSSIQVGQNEVRVDKPWPGRAQLAMRYTYHSCDNNTSFYQPGGQGVPVECEKHELVFPHGEPEDVTCSPYPEKVVLAFYNHYTEERARSYFTEEGWEQLGRCAGSQCGCTSARSEIEHVRVTQLEPGDRDADPNRATVVATVICERRNAAPDAARSIRWNLICEDNHWKLDSAQ